MKAFRIPFQVLLVACLAFPTLSKAAAPPRSEDTRKTYTWLVPELNGGQNNLLNSTYARRTIQNAFEENLKKRGLDKNAGSSDYVLQFHTFAHKVTRNYYGGYPGMWGYGFWGMPYGGFNRPTSDVSQKGTLVLDIKDAKTGELIWQDAISTEFSNPRKLDKKIDRSVRKLLKKIPSNI